MCRYSEGPRYGTWVCFECRVAWKKEPHAQNVECSKCKGPAAYMGRDLKAPRQTQVNQWRKVKMIFERMGPCCFDSCGCGGPGRRSSTLAEEKQLHRELARRGSPSKRMQLAVGVDRRAKLAVRGY